jgi:hypothetical protein
VKVNHYCVCSTSLHYNSDPYCWICSKLRKQKEVSVQHYKIIHTIEGDRIEAIKLLSDEKVSGVIDGIEQDGMPVLHLKNGKTILIGEKTVSLMQEEKEGKEETK